MDRKTEKKKFCPDFRSYSAWGRKFQKNSKKNQKIKKSLSGIIFSQNGWRSAEKEREKNLVPNSVHTWPGEENSQKKNRKKNQKIKKSLSGISFNQNRRR